MKLNRILVDSRSSMDILFKFTFDKIGIIDIKLEHINTSLKGFRGGRFMLLRIINLSITIGTRPLEKNMMLDFIVVEEIIPY